jgi:hypothetical protein
MKAGFASERYQKREAESERGSDLISEGSGFLSYVGSTGDF